MKSILDKSFQYRNSASTNVAETFQRIREEQKKQKEEKERIVRPIIKAKVIYGR